MISAIWVVNEDQQCEVLLTHAFNQDSTGPEDVAEMAEHLGDPDHCQFGCITEQFHPGPFQFSAPHPAEMDILGLRLHGPDQIGAMQISRGLPGHDHNLPLFAVYLRIGHRGFVGLMPGKGYEQVASPLLGENLFNALPVAVDLFHHLQGHIQGPSTLLPSNCRSSAVPDMFDEIA